MTTPESDGEVVDVFIGDTLEEAMAAAVAALGPALEVRRARKVRAGVRGLLGRDRYEVLAVPSAGAVARSSDQAEDDAVGSALDALLEATDEREARGLQARPTSGPGPAAGTRPGPAAAAPTSAPLSPEPVGRPSADRPLPDPEPTGPDEGAAAQDRPTRLGPRPRAARPSSPRRTPAAPAPVGPSTPPAPLPPAPRSGGSPFRRATRPAPPPAAAPAAGPAPRSAGTAPSELPPAVLSGAPDAVGPAEDAPARRRGPAPALARRSPHPDPAVGDHPEPAALPRRRRPDEADAPAALLPAPPAAQGALEALSTTASRPTAPADEATRPAPLPARTSSRGSSRARGAGPAGWSRAALAALGVPAPVLDALPAAEPRDDLAWVVALTAAVEAVVPAPAEPDEAHPVVLSGHGLAGALAILEAGARGVAPGTLSHAGRTAPATATELALVLRHHVVGGG